MMAGGYFDLPLASFDTPTVQDASQRRRRLSSSQKSTPITQSNEGSPIPTCRTGDNPTKPWNEGALKATNSVKSIAEELSHMDEDDDQVTSEPDFDNAMPPPRPPPAVCIPDQERSIRDTNVLIPLGGDASVISDVTGSTSRSRASSPQEQQTANWENGIDDLRERCFPFAQEISPKSPTHLPFFFRKTAHSGRTTPLPNLPVSTTTKPIESILFEVGDEIHLIAPPENPFKDSTDEDEDTPIESDQQRRSTNILQAYHIVQQMTRRSIRSLTNRTPSPGLQSRQATDIDDEHPDSYVPGPTHYHGGILSTLLKLYDHQLGHEFDIHDPRHLPGGTYGRGGSISDTSFRGRSLSRDSGNKRVKPRKWYEKSPSLSTSSLATSSAKNSFSSSLGQRPLLKRSRSSGGLSAVARRLMRPHLENEIRISVHIAEILSRQRYCMRLCRALMKYGAPTHRLEEYMRMTARVLEIDAQFLYIPGCMIISFDDASTHTTEVRLVKSPQGVDLGRLYEVHQIYKEVVHDVIGVEEAIQRLDEIMKREPRFSTWFLVIMHGFASASVGPFAFGARPIDTLPAFLLGCLLGILQLVLSPRSHLYSNVFEISAAVLTSFLSRAFGSIPYQNERLFCFSALAQSSIAMILPGYMVLCGSLELQSRSIVAGSVRMVYAIIYSLFLGFGITIGTAVYGLLDPNATTDIVCPPSPISNPYLQRLPFVILFTFCLTTINQAKWRHVPVMLAISLCGYIVNFFSMKRFGSNTQVSNALGAFVIGVMGNLYSRLQHGLAAAAILPAIFVQVPSGLASSGSLVSGIMSAEQISGNNSFYNIINNGTQGFMNAQNNLSLAGCLGNQQYSGMVFDIGYGMVQVAIGITVGLFLAALVVYPFGKKRSGLFSF